MGDFQHDQWDSHIGEFDFDDVFGLEQRIAAKPQMPKDGTVAGADGTSNEPRADRTRATVSSMVAGKTDTTPDLRKTILGLENARLLLEAKIKQLESLSWKVDRIVQHLGELQPFPAEIRAMVKEVMTKADSGCEVKSPVPKLAVHSINHGSQDLSKSSTGPV